MSPDRRTGASDDRQEVKWLAAWQSPSVMSLFHRRTTALAFDIAAEGA
jgi:hypothetical protein